MSSTENTLEDKTSKMTLANITPPSTPPRRHVHKTSVQHESEGKLCSPKIPSVLSPPASPSPNGPKFTDKDKVSAESIKRPSVSELRTRLGINDWKCGATTKSGRPCTYPIPGCEKKYPKEADSKKAEIDTQIELVRNCTYSSGERLRQELSKLARIVHCDRYMHNIDIRRLSRVDSWRNEFDLKESIEEQILKKLQCFDPICLGKNRFRKPCGYGMKGLCAQKRRETIDEILKPNIYSNDEGLTYFLQVLQWCMFCKYHIKTQGPGKVAAWKEEIQNICKEKNHVNSPEDKDATAQPAFQLPDRHPFNYWTREYDDSPFDLLPNNTSNNSRLSFPKIQTQLETPLEQGDPKKGYVYAYEVAGNPGFVKIGYTEDIERRHEEWERDCNRKPLPLFHTKVRNPHRVEELCHAELNHRKTPIECHACLRAHVEWFKVSPEEAIDVIQKWSGWMSTKPYTTEGTLKQTERVKARDIDGFMKQLSATPHLEK